MESAAIFSLILDNFIPVLAFCCNAKGGGPGLFRIVGLGLFTFGLRFGSRILAKFSNLRIRNGPFYLRIEIRIADSRKKIKSSDSALNVI